MMEDYVTPIVLIASTAGLGVLFTIFALIVAALLGAALIYLTDRLLDNLRKLRAILRRKKP